MWREREERIDQAFAVPSLVCRDTNQESSGSIELFGCHIFHLLEQQWSSKVGLVRDTAHLVLRQSPSREISSPEFWPPASFATHLRQSVKALQSSR